MFLGLESESAEEVGDVDRIPSCRLCFGRAINRVKVAKFALDINGNSRKGFGRADPVDVGCPDHMDARIVLEGVRQPTFAYRFVIGETAHCFEDTICNIAGLDSPGENLRLEFCIFVRIGVCYKFANVGQLTGFFQRPLHCFYMRSVISMNYHDPFSQVSRTVPVLHRFLQGAFSDQSKNSHTVLTP